MKHLLLILLTAGVAMSTACSSNETMSESEDDTGDTIEAAPAATPARTTKSTPPEPVKAVVEEEPDPEAEASDDQETTTTSSSDGSSMTYVCTHGDKVRTIRVIYHDEGPKACEVTYEKSTGTQSLWSAISDEAYCEDRAAEFVTKQEGWGWECTKE